MTQASISLITRPLGLADLEPLLYELTLAVNLSGIGSAPVAYPMQPLPGSWLGSLNSFAAAVNAVTAFNTVTEATTSDPASLTGILNTMIEEINAFVSGGGGYTGPLDIVPGAVVAYGQRALSAARLGSPLYTIREDAGDTTQSFSSDAVTGEAPVAEITAFLAGANGFVTTWNDQSANAADVSQAVSNIQPGFVLDAIPALKQQGNTGYLEASPTLDSFSAITAFFVVSSAIGGHASKAIDWYSSGSGFITINMNPGAVSFAIGEIDVDNGSDDGTHEAGTTTGQWLSDTSPVIVVVRSSGGTPDVSVNGITPLAATPYGDNVFGPTGVITYVNTPSFGSGAADTLFREEIVYNSALSDGDVTAILQNIAAANGITLP